MQIILQLLLQVMLNISKRFLNIKDIEIVLMELIRSLKRKEKEVTKDKDIKILYAGNIGVAQTY